MGFIVSRRAHIRYLLQLTTLRGEPALRTGNHLLANLNELGGCVSDVVEITSKATY